MTRIISSLILVLACALPAWAQQEAGRTVMVTGVAYATDAQGKQRRLSRGDTVYSGETISTLRHSYVNVLYRDTGRTLVGPNSQMQIKEFSYKPAASSGPRQKGSSASESSGRSLFSLIKGGLRAVTGLIGSRDRSAYSLSTPVATIGIRGTDYFVVVCEEQCVNMGAPDGVEPKGGVVLGVYEGGVFAVNEQGERHDLSPDEFLLVAANGQFHELPGEPPFMLTTPMDNPENCQ